MSREVTEQSRTISAASLLVVAVGAAAFGAVAIGVLAIGRPVGRLVIKKARFNELEVDNLTVHRLRVVEHKGADQSVMPRWRQASCVNRRQLLQKLPATRS
jgi:hypothetical protein